MGISRFLNALTIKRVWLLAFVLTTLMLGLLIRSCDCQGCRPEPVVPHGVDASVQLTRIDQRVDAAVQLANARLAQIAAEHDAAIQAFTLAEQREYEDVKAQGPEAVEAWINEWYAEQRGGRP